MLMIRWIGSTGVEFGKVVSEKEAHELCAILRKHDITAWVCRL